MGSEYQLSLSNSSKFRDPSFSAYLNGADGRLGVKLAVLTRSGSSADEEIEVFSADKYFNGEIKDEQKPEEGVRRSAVSEGPLKSKISLGTPSTRSESSSWHSQTALLHSLPSQVPLSRSTGEVQRKKNFFSRIRCRCFCVSKKSLKTECTGQGMNQTDQLLETKATSPRMPSMKANRIPYPSIMPSLIHNPMSSPELSENPSPNLLKGIKEGRLYNDDSFDPPATGKVIKKSFSLGRKLSPLNWDELNPRSKDANMASTSISVDYYTDAESDSSSDLFEIDSLTGHKKTSFSSQIPDSSVSGYATPTTCHAPSEASFNWSVATASAADFSTLLCCEESKLPTPVTNTRNNSDPVGERRSWRNKENAGRSLICGTNQTGMRVLQNVELQNAEENINCHQRIHMDKFVPFSRVQAQAMSQPPKASRSHSDMENLIYNISNDRL